MVDSGHYDSVSDLVKNLNSCIVQHAQSKIQFTYNKRTGKVTVDLKKAHEYLVYGKYRSCIRIRTCYIMKKTILPYTPDSNAGFSSMFVYCNLASDQIVGDKKVPLLSAV